jgi:hypothetical protein
MRFTLLMAAVCLLLSGCGRRGPEVVPVDGKITSGGGSWPKPGMLYFTPEQPANGLPNRPAWAKFTTEGKFHVTSFTPDDGLVPGRYRVGVECFETPPAMGAVTPARSRVPQKYRSPATSGLEVNVAPGQRKVSLNWDVPKP